MPTVAQIVDQQVTQALAGQGSLARMATYSSWNPPDYTTCTRNNSGPNANWVAALSCDHSAVCFHDSSRNEFASHTLVHPRFTLKAAHESGGISTVVKFAQQLSPYTITEHTVVDSRDVNDIRVCLLNLPVSVATPAYVLPKNWRDYLPLIGTDVSSDSTQDPFNPNGLPVACYDKDNNVISAWWYADDTTAAGTQAGAVGCHEPENADFQVMYQLAIGGDSGGAVALPFPPANRIILLGVTYGSQWAASSVADNYDAIEAAMNEMLPGATLTPVDWSGYSTGPLVRYSFDARFRRRLEFDAYFRRRLELEAAL